ncbi:hypothetical protein M427DRAFT_355751 [Gonapodya prolifera JEL478]|uniref:Uncharacterized protein n=1 Tax=Gonapodya prolifera (strain JEL478) TaxID=1344416 RepID=A0A139ABJ6_GONPJ|nr:hypothetical protein M427DRAFT_355751 [Gonapodya prolifera JEL478]|eukprot:KXS14202.1 hypothetical protein M427DRAFT_355751 [Gonapodya prolifera JEL478]
MSKPTRSGPPPSCLFAGCPPTAYEALLWWPFLPAGRQLDLVRHFPDCTFRCSDIVCAIVSSLMSDVMEYRDPTKRASSTIPKVPGFGVLYSPMSFPEDSPGVLVLTSATCPRRSSFR